MRLTWPTLSYLLLNSHHPPFGLLSMVKYLATFVINFILCFCFRCCEYLVAGLRKLQRTSSARGLAPSILSAVAAAACAERVPTPNRSAPASAAETHHVGFVRTPNRSAPSPHSDSMPNFRTRNGITRTRKKITRNFWSTALYSQRSFELWCAYRLQTGPSYVPECESAPHHPIF